MQAGSGDTGGGAGGAAATYRGLRSRRAVSSLSDINVTPLVDVVLVLLLVFMVTAPMMNRGIDVSLPVASQSSNDEEDRIAVTVTEQERIYIGKEPIALQLLEDTLRQMMQGRASKVVYLRADERLRYGKVIEVVDKAKRAGVEQIGFVYVLPQEKAPRP
jgi:biopolymer transport protein TolR